MELIKLDHTLPMAFSGQVQPVSDVWHRELSFRRGEHVLIEAASGTGKTSLCSYVYGYREDYEGTICFDGKDIRRLKTGDWAQLRKRSLSKLFQELRLFPGLTV